MRTIRGGAVCLAALMLVVPAFAARAQAEPDPESAKKLDDFDAGTLGPEWEVQNRDDSLWSLTSNPGHLTLTTVEGDLYGSIRSARNVLLRTLQVEGDFDVIAQVEFAPTESWQQLSLMVGRDGGDFVSIKALHDGPGTILQFGRQARSSFRVLGSEKADLGKPYYLRVARRGTTYSGSFRGPDQKWIEVGRIGRIELAEPRVGLYAATGGQSSAGRAQARIDWVGVIGEARPSPTGAAPAPGLVKPPLEQAPVAAARLAADFPRAIVTTLRETPEAFRNPMKGFRPSRYLADAGFAPHEYASTYKHYIAYTELEDDPSDGAQKIEDWCDRAWAGIEKRNVKVIPRVVIAYPGAGEFWPRGVPHGRGVSDWTSEALKKRLALFAAKLGKAWDDDPRVAAVEMGLWGKWGEHHVWPDSLPGGNDRIPADVQQVLGEAFTRAFRNKVVMVRYPETFTAFDFGYLWDSFALPDDAASGEGIIERDRWRTRMVSGEVAYDWGDQTQLGKSPDGTLGSASNTDHVIDWIRRTHASSLGWIAQYTPDGGAVSANAARMQKALGYRFVIQQAAYPPRVDGKLTVSFSVQNVGSAPFYARWPVELSLLRSDRSVAWARVLEGADVRTWLPGGAQVVTETLDVSGLPVGTYTLSVAVLDPAGSRPALRFANLAYYRGGRTPIGRVGVGQEPSDQDLGAFDGLKDDDQLSYGAR